MKTMLITGGGGGLGSAIARAADAAGYQVAVCDKNIDAAERCVADLSHGMAFALDVCDPQGIEQVVRQLPDLSVVVNNAGILRTGSLLQQTAEDFSHVLNVHLVGAFNVARAAAHSWHEAGQPGVIINMASINGLHPSPGSGAYASAKAGLIALTELMAIEWGGAAIRANAIAPGFIDAGMSTPFYADPAVRARRSAAVPSQRLGSADDIAQAVLYLASDAAAYVNGHTLTVDGGVSHSVLAQLPRD